MLYIFLRGFTLSFTYLRKFFVVFLLAYFTIIIIKFLFLYYLHDIFIEYAWKDLIYAIFWGYKFDFSSSAMVAFLSTLFDFKKKSFAFIGSALLMTVFFIQIGDILYFNESSRHIGYEITDSLTDANSLFMTAYSQHTLFTILSLLMGMILFLLSFKWLLKFEETVVDRFYFFKKIFLIFLTIFFIRGMTQSIPLNPWQSNQIGDSKLAMLSLNSVYNVVYVLANSKKKLAPLKLPTVDEKVRHKAFSYLYGLDTPDIKVSRKPLLKEKPNVVFLFLESWSGVNMKSYGYAKETTPFFDALLEKSVRPKAMIASGHRTTEGMFAVLSSFQNPLGKSVAKTNLQSFKYGSIINILTQKDTYASAFFQGTSKETSGTGSLAQSLGFKESYGKRDVVTRLYEENSWGVHDSDLYAFALEKVSKMKKPFVIGINGATTHDDKIPKGVETLKFTEDKKLNSQLNALQFADRALKEFVSKFEIAYPNTLFVLFADHCGGVKGSAFENYLIPFALYHKDLKPKFYDVFLSQRDIAPMVYDLVYGNYTESNVAFSGKSLFSDKQFFADYYHNGVLGWIEGDFILELNTVTNKSKCYEIIDFKDKEIKCEEAIIAFRNRALSFTQTSQTLLFSGETDKFIHYRNLK